MVFKVATLLGMLDIQHAEETRVGSVVRTGAKVPDAVLDRVGCDGGGCVLL